MNASPPNPYHPTTLAPHHPPSSTYRVQLNADFTFADARAIVPYLHDLGIGTLYTSPFLRATPGSSHGYDVTDYGSLNPEIGSEEDLTALSDALRARDMGLLVDVVPNHMGIAGDANAWWQDVLENGRTSPYADYFDIDWRPLKEELRGKILLPVLGDHYGVVLERGELRLAYADGAFTISYFETALPIAPPAYPIILVAALERWVGDKGDEPAGQATWARHAVPLQGDARPSPIAMGEGPAVRAEAADLLELQSIITAFERLPPQHEQAPDLVAERRREQIVAKRRLAELVAASPEVARAIAATVHAFNGDPDHPQSFDAIDRLLDAQSYRLSSFRTAGEEINYRRFFAINDLAAVRQEVPEVFAAAHGLLMRLVAARVVTGLRIDHPDGLWDPAGYFRDLQHAAWLALRDGHGPPDAGDALATGRPLYVVVEKILEPNEALPHDWAVHGTVGYEFARVTTGLFVESAQQRAFDDLYTRVGGEGRRQTFAAVAYDTKNLMLRTALASETNVLARALNRISEQNRRTRDFTLNALRQALREVIAAFPIYRTYVVCGEDLSDHDRHATERAVALAKRRNPASDLTVFEFLEDVLLLRDDGTLSGREREERCQFVMKFQQFTGPVMAKGVEDTAFYRYNRLVALNEVGSDPAMFGTSGAEFHRQNAERARYWPHALLTSSTHDTKRSEDVRARIAVLSELPREWRTAVNRWARLNRRRKTRIEGVPAPDRNDEYLFYQTLLGAWPWDMETPDEEFVDRIAAFMQKAVREAQVHTSWVNPDAGYEDALAGFVRAALDASRPNPFLDDLAPLRELVAHAGACNALAQQLLKLTAPGVPDIYQGTELWDQSLVDPDNRRPVDFAPRAHILSALAARPPSRDLARELLETKADGRVKLYLTSRALAFRNARPALFASGDYLPLHATGAAADRVIAFARRHTNEEVIVAVPRLIAGLVGNGLFDPIGPEVWGDTLLLVPDIEPGTRYRDIFSGEFVEPATTGSGPGLLLGDVFAALSFALLDRIA